MGFYNAISPEDIHGDFIDPCECEACDAYYEEHDEHPPHGCVERGDDFTIPEPDWEDC